MKENVTTSIYLDKRRKKIDGSYPIKLRVTHERKSKLYSTNYTLTSDDFEKVMGDKPKKEFKKHLLSFSTLEKDAIKVIEMIDDFSFEKFENLFINRKGSPLDVFMAYTEQIRSLKANNQFATASTYETAKKSFKAFYDKPVLKFEDVTVSFLKKYETWMKIKEKSVSTVSINTRTLRRLFNIAISMDEVPQKTYPFGPDRNGKYQPPEHINNKRALSKGDLKKLFDYNSEDELEKYYKDLWFMSYLCNGMNMADIFRLKYKNIDGDTIRFIRHKTSHQRKLKPVSVVLTEDVQNIISKWGTKPYSDDNYIFKVLNPKMGAEKQISSIKIATRLLNKHIKRIAKRVGVEQNISSYTARHSFATVLRDSGESIAFISESMGHGNQKTTEDYFATFDDKRKKTAALKLTDW